MWGDVMPYEKGKARLSRGNVFLQATSLSLEMLFVVSEVLSYRLVNNTVFAMSHQVGIWAHRGPDSPVIHPT